MNIFEQAAPAYYSHPRPEVRRLLPGSVRRVLDVGCAAGALGAALKAERPGLEVFGIEPTARAALWASKRLDGVLHGDAATVELPFPEAYFDCLVFADSLEHMSASDQVLRRLLSYLQPGGYVVLSVPNIRHYDISGPLLRDGTFTYQDAGILDRTHLRFYTYRELETLLEDMGLNWEALDGAIDVSDPETFERTVAAVGLLGGDEEAFRSEGAVIRYLIRARKPVAGESLVRGPFAPVPTPAPAPAAAEPAVSIVVLTFNQLEHTRRCFDSLFQSTSLPFELLVIDNASTDETPTYLAELAAREPRVRVVFNQENHGFAHGCNQGIALARGAVIVLLNNDTILTPRWLEGLILPMAEDKSIGAVGPRTNRIIGPQQLPFVPYGSDLDAMQRFAAWYTHRHRDRAWLDTRAVGFCLALRRDALERVGGLDTRFGRGNFEDDDLCLRLQVAGYKIAITCASFVHHVGSASFSVAPEAYRQLLVENFHRFAAKWGFNPGSGGSYEVSGLIHRAFDPLRDVVPLCVPEAPPFPLNGARTRRILAVADDTAPEALLQAVGCFQAAFQAADDVSLIIWAPPERVRDLQQLAGSLTPLCDGADAADVLLVPDSPSPLAVGGIYTATDRCLDLGDLGVIADARRSGRLVVTAAELAALAASWRTPGSA